MSQHSISGAKNHGTTHCRDSGGFAQPPVLHPFKRAGTCRMPADCHHPGQIFVWSPWKWRASHIKPANHWLFLLTLLNWLGEKLSERGQWPQCEDRSLQGVLPRNPERPAVPQEPRWHLLTFGVRPVSEQWPAPWDRLDPTPN